MKATAASWYVFDPEKKEREGARETCSTIVPYANIYVGFYLIHFA